MKTNTLEPGRGHRHAEAVLPADDRRGRALGQRADAALQLRHGGEAVVDVSGNVESDPGMTMNMVVSVDETGHEGPRVGQGAEVMWRLVRSRD